MQKKLYIFVDDERNKLFNIISNNNKYTYQHCYNYEQTIKTLIAAAAERIDIVIDLDHDLGEEKTGYDIAKFIVENQIKLNSFKLHSMNVVGRENIKQLLTHYGYKQDV